MDLYRIALFLHIVTLIVAAGASAVMKLAASRRANASTAREMLDWHGVMSSTGIAFPICLAAFVVTGSYMLSFAQARIWSAGFVVAGLAGVVLLFASGGYLKRKAKELEQVLQTIVARSPDAAAPRLVPPLLVTLLPVVNSGIVFAVVFDMVLKPASVSVALGVLAVGIILASLIALSRRPAGVPASAVQVARAD